MRLLLTAGCVLLLHFSFAQGGPGGIGNTDGASSLVLWLDAGNVPGANGATITTWNDKSGYGNHFTAGNGAVFNTSGVNGYPTFSFNGSSHYFQSAFSASMTPNPLTLATAVNVTSSGNYKAVLSNRDDPAGAATAGFILYSIPTTNNWSFWNGRAGGAWEQTTGGSTAGAWASVTGTYITGANGKNLYVNNTLAATSTHSLSSNTAQVIRVGAGQNEGGPNFYFQGQMGEVILYNVVLNQAQIIILNNYLAAKYNFTLTSNDLYTRDDVANGNFDHEVAGIGRVNATNIHSDAQGTGKVRIRNPGGLGDGEYFFWGHDNGALTVNTTDVPAGVQGRINRVWAITETGAVGTLDVRFDMAGLGTPTAGDLRLLIDHDGDGIFNEAGTLQLAGATALGGNEFQFAGVADASLANGRRFTIGSANLAQTTLPVALVSFKGQMDAGTAWLTWVTATETNNQVFTVERATDGNHFFPLAEIPGAGTSLEQHTYRYSDPFPPFGRIYYRVRQTDYDGTSSHTGVIALFHEGGTNSVITVPNPVKKAEELTLRIDHTEMIDHRDVTLSAADLTGRDISVQVVSRDRHQLTVRFTQTTASGIYIFSVRSPGLAHPLYSRIQVVD